MKRVIVTGTDTGVGKTVFASGLAGALDGFYWKPIQAGTEPEGDRETARRLSGLPPERILPEAYRLKLPASPHLSAREEGIEIVPERLAVPDAAGPLVIEGAGGVLVPVTEHLLMVDLFAQWQAPAIVCARTGLGTINHSLMTIEALRARSVRLIGIVFIGAAHEENERIVPRLAGVPHLGRLPQLDPLNSSNLRDAMAAIDLEAIRSAM